MIVAIVPGESVILSVNTTALVLEDDKEYCSTNASLTGEPATQECIVCSVHMVAIIYGYRQCQAVQCLSVRIQKYWYNGQYFCSNSEYNNHLAEPPTGVDDGYDPDGGSDSTTTSDGLSTGAVAGLAVALTLLVALPVGVVLGWCIWRCGRGPSGKGTQQKVQEAIYEVPGPGPVDTAIPLTDNQAYGLVKKN